MNSWLSIDDCCSARSTIDCLPCSCIYQLRCMSFYGTDRHASMSKIRTEQNLFVHSGKSEAEATNNRRLCSTYCTTEALRSLSVTAEPLVIRCAEVGTNSLYGKEEQKKTSHTSAMWDWHWKTKHMPEYFYSHGDNYMRSHNLLKTHHKILTITSGRATKCSIVNTATFTKLLASMHQQDSEILSWNKIKLCHNIKQ